MTLKDLGYTPNLDKYRADKGLDSLAVGRVIAEHKERYVVKTPEKEYDAEILGNLRYAAQSRSDFPAVGDWVALSEYDDDKALIHAVLPRKSTIERQAPGKKGDKQTIAVNIDTAFIVQAVDRDFSVNRLERYLAICWTSGIEPIVILSKIDLIDEHHLSELIQNIRKRQKKVQILAISNESLRGIEELKALLDKGKTCCLLGSSGVGKTTLLNMLIGRDLMRTGPISEHTNRGRHVTTHRELHVLESGGIIIDNPGMREVGIADASNGIGSTFESIHENAQKCRFKNCTHVHETGCAVLKALETGEIDPESYENYLKMERERAHFESSQAERRKRDRVFGKLMKNYKKGNFKED